ncbi:MAG: cupin [Planctomycetes bacterium]|nr:cupin [Planctomycetota bacterium]
MPRHAEMLLPGRPFAETLTFFREHLGFRLESIRPADDPAVAIVSGFGLRLRLDADHTGDAGALRIDAERDEDLTAPNGTRIALRGRTPQPVPEPGGEPTLVGAPGPDDWTVGRAGMLYRDLIPGRLGGHLIASHIRIPDGGPVADDVHFHDVRFQMIHCLRGSVRLVYEDQGPPFELRAGETVLQPPHIRHRVLSCSDQLEVVELTSPADHLTSLDHHLELPNAGVDAARDFGGQRFFAGDAVGRGGSADGERSTFGAATGGIAELRTVRGSNERAQLGDDLRVTFAFVTRGNGHVTLDGRRHAIEAGGALALPPGRHAEVEGQGLELLHCRLRAC